MDELQKAFAALVDTLEGKEKNLDAAEEIMAKATRAMEAQRIHLQAREETLANHEKAVGQVRTLAAGRRAALKTAREDVQHLTDKLRECERALVRALNDVGTLKKLLADAQLEKAKSE